MANRNLSYTNLWNEQHVAKEITCQPTFGNVYFQFLGVFPHQRSYNKDMMGYSLFLHASSIDLSIVVTTTLKQYLAI